jgi:hypothetical protein
MLDLSKALSFFLSILSLYWAAISAFFVPGAHWQERLLLALPRLAIAACICFVSALVFTWPSRSNPDAGQPIASTLPARLFLWGTSGILLLFFLSWYLVANAPCIADVARACG